MPAFVLDVSIALSWCFSDEATPETWQLLERLEQESAIVPELWLLEVGNVLVNAERRGRITEARVTEFLELLAALDIEVDNETSLRAGREIVSLARSHRLTTYDAAYLELAMRLGLPLASKDDALRSVAKKLGATVFPLEFP
jgi:predicted nucleic acid-binding protein